MRPGIIVDVTAADRASLEAIIADRNSPQKHGTLPVKLTVTHIVVWS